MQGKDPTNTPLFAPSNSTLISRFRRKTGYLVAGTALFVAAVAPLEDASAQYPAGSQIPIGQQTLQRQQEQDYRTAKEREAENYEARGVHLGSFFLFPTLEADEVFDDNIYASSAGRTASFVQVVKPSVELRSGWSTHMLNLFARGAFGFYSADATQNYQDVSAGGNGRVDITRFANAYAGASYNLAHEALGTPNTANGAFSINKYNQWSGNVGYFQQFNRIKTQLDGQVDYFNYIDNGVGLAQGVIPNTDRNRIEFRENLRLAYEFVPGYEIWTSGGLNQRTYDKSVDSLGFNHNSTGWDVVGGVSVGLTSITAIEAFAGYMAQDYADSRFSRVSTPTFGLTGFWSPLRELVVKPYVRRTVDDTAIASNSGYLSTSGGIDVNYKYRPNIQLDVHGDYSIADYQAVSTSTGGRYDQYYTARAGILYLPTEHFFVGPSYQFVHRTSNQVGLNYDDNQILLRLGARL